VPPGGRGPPVARTVPCPPRPRQWARTAAPASGPRPPVPRESKRQQVNASEVAHHAPYRRGPHSRPASLASRSLLPIRSSPASPFPSLPRSSTSAVLTASLVPSSCPHALLRPFLLAAAPPPAFLLSRLGCPARCLFCRSRKGGPARSGGPPFLESPGAQRNLGRSRGGGPLNSEPQQPEINTHRSTSTDQRGGPAQGHIVISAVPW
jgi:hypothetical protein